MKKGKMFVKESNSLVLYNCKIIFNYLIWESFVRLSVELFVSHTKSSKLPSKITLYLYLDFKIYSILLNY